VTGAVAITSTASASASNVGALIVAGGVGCGNLYAGTDVRATRDLYSGGNVFVSTYAGGGYRTAYYDNNGAIQVSSSDSRMKKDIVDMTYGLNEIKQLRPVSFYWLDEKSGGTRRDLGLIAQETKDIIPEVVTQNSNGMYSLDYTKLIGVLIKSVKDQQTIIETQTSELKSQASTISQQSSTISSLTSRIDSLEAKQVKTIQPISQEKPKSKMKAFMSKIKQDKQKIIKSVCSLNSKHSKEIDALKSRIASLENILQSFIPPKLERQTCDEHANNDDEKDDDFQEV
jgi:hypothetical protein